MIFCKRFDLEWTSQVWFRIRADNKTISDRRTFIHSTLWYTQIDHITVSNAILRLARIKAGPGPVAKMRAPDKSITAQRCSRYAVQFLQIAGQILTARPGIAASIILALMRPWPWLGSYRKLHLYTGLQSPSTPDVLMYVRVCEEAVT